MLSMKTLKIQDAHFIQPSSDLLRSIADKVLHSLFSVRLDKGSNNSPDRGIRAHMAVQSLWE